MNESGQHWTNRVQDFAFKEVKDLIECLNVFYENRFVIATQVFPPQLTETKNWVAIVYFKVPPVKS